MSESFNIVTVILFCAYVCVVAAASGWPKATKCYKGSFELNMYRSHFTFQALAYCFFPVRYENHCPYNDPYHPYPFPYLNGFFCCKFDHNKFLDEDGGKDDVYGCNGPPGRLEFDSNCCHEGRNETEKSYIKCPTCVYDGNYKCSKPCADIHRGVIPKEPETCSEDQNVCKFLLIQGMKCAHTVCVI